MSNITLDAAHFSEQLGLYDFFDVLVGGSVFVWGLSALYENIYSLLWTDLSIEKALGIVLLVYICGIVLQEIGSIVDRHFWGIKNLTRSTFLFDIKELKTTDKLKYWASSNFIGKIFLNNSTDIGKWNWVLSNKILLDHYRKHAKQIYSDYFPDKEFKETDYNDEKFNSFIFSVIQYRTACYGKDKKSEKLRALYSLSRTLTVCFAFFALLILGVNKLGCFNNWLKPGNTISATKFFYISVFLIFLFFFRMKKCKKYMALIMLGNYDAILQSTTQNKPEEIVLNCSPKCLTNSMDEQNCAVMSGSGK